VSDSNAGSGSKVSPPPASKAIINLINNAVQKEKNSMHTLVFLKLSNAAGKTIALTVGRDRRCLSNYVEGKKKERQEFEHRV
jgi:hypothetical protein